MSGSGLWFSRFACAGEGWLPLVAFGSMPVAAFGSMPVVQGAMDAAQPAAADNEAVAIGRGRGPGPGPVHAARVQAQAQLDAARASTAAR